jgi:AraC-like DNA-binding protein
MDDGNNEGFDNDHYFIIPKEFLNRFQENLLSEFLIVTDIGQFIKAKHHYCSRPEGIDTAQLIYCYEGTGFYSLDCRENKAVNPGQLIFLPSGIPHAYASTDDDPWSVLWIHIKGRCLDSLCKAWPPPEVISISNTYDRQIKEIFYKCFSILSVPYQWEEFFYLCQLAAVLLSLIPSAARQSVKGLTAGRFKCIESIISYMKNHLKETVALEDLAATSGYSPSYLNYLFRTSSGYAPIEYFLRMKIQAAAKDIAFSELPIYSIAEAYGIKDAYYFSRLFKRISGISPAQYRKSTQLIGNRFALTQNWLASRSGASQNSRHADPTASDSDEC